MTEKTYEELQIELLQQELKKKNAKISQLEKGATPSKFQEVKASKDKYKNQSKELKEEVKQLRTKNTKLTKELEKTKNGGTPSTVEKMKAQRDKYKNKSKVQQQELQTLSHNYEQLLQINAKNTKTIKRRVETYPGHDHLIFNQFFERANEYENKPFLKKQIDVWIDELNIEINQELKQQNIYLNALLSVEEKEQQYNNNDDLKKALTIEETTVLDLNLDKDEVISVMDILEEQLEENKKWRDMKNGIDDEQSDIPDEMTPELYRLKSMFKDIYNLIKNVRNIYEYQGCIEVTTNDKKNLVGLVTRELEKQVGLCKDPINQLCYYNNGEGSMLKFILPSENVAYDALDRIIRENTMFMQNGKFIDNNFINSEVVYNEIPKDCGILREPDDGLVGFKNGFFNIKQAIFKENNSKIPILPSKNIKVNYYPDKKIDGGYLEEIVTTCLTPQDQDIFLTYVGCCIYDKGYQGRQETLFILGKAKTGKSSLIKAMSHIFYYPASQSAAKMTTEHNFSYLPFKEGDIVVIDEIQGAGTQFCQAFKEVSSGNAIAVEAKGKDVQELPPSKIAKIIAIGNYLPPEIEENLQDEGVMRRILPIIPIKSMIIADDEKDLFKPNCLEWLVQKATEKYIEHGLHKHSKGLDILSTKERDDRVLKLIHPEAYFIQQYYDIHFDENDKPSEAFLVPVKEIGEYLIDIIAENMLEPTINCKDPYAIAGEVNRAFQLGKYGLVQKHGNVYYCPGLNKKEDVAIVTI